MRLTSNLPVALAGLALAVTPAHGLTPGTKNVIAQMFQWSWDSIAAECTNFLGPSGYGYVQVSPPQESVPGTWFTDYQPVSYQLIGKHGNRAQFSNMVSTCKNAGVGIIVDSVWNHMTSQTSSGTGTAGSTWTTKYNYPGLYNTTNFHHCTLTSDGQIQNYSVSAQVWTCELDELADLATDTEYVRAKLAAYANDLISLGVAGLRLDAAKHMDPSSIANILARLTKKVYITQETIWGPYDAVTPAMYTGNGDVQEFRYTTAFQQAFNGQGGGLASLQTLDNGVWATGPGANVFVTNHDTERNGGSLNYMQSNLYTNAMVLSLAHPYGNPTILSSYQFTGTGDGAPNNGVGTCSLNGGANGWLCQHRWPQVASMTLFRNAVSGLKTNWVSPQPNQIAFGRGNSGYVAINNADGAWSTTFTTSLAAGTYCDVLTGVVNSASTCSGKSFTVSSSGTFFATVPARGAIAIRLGQTITPAMVPVTFASTVTTVYGENVFVSGSIPQLGSWAPDASIALSSASYPVWKATVKIPGGSAFQYKYLKKEANGSVVWESDPNRSDSVPTSGTQTLNDSWQ